MHAEVSAWGARNGLCRDVVVLGRGQHPHRYPPWSDFVMGPTNEDL